jgi:PLP dependent protein
MIAKYTEIVQSLKERHVSLVAVSKTQPNEKIMALYEAGQRIFGENRVQELTEKHEQLPKDIKWHMIGHLQKNKVKYIAPFVDTIQSVDDMELVKLIQKEAQKYQRNINLLLQVKIAEEDSKYGIAPEEIKEFAAVIASQGYPNIVVSGLMGMASFTDNEAQVRSEFQLLKRLFDELKAEVFPEEPSFRELSMGMSGDYELAIQSGATSVRLGSLIFGERN